MEKFRIITWNIGEDERNSDGKLTIDSYDYIVDTIKNERADIICLQEAIVKSDYLPSIAEYITKNTGLKYSVEYELSDSHINIGCKMGVVICSKYELSNVEKVLLDNPNLVYQVNENTTYYSHDKGFIITNVEGVTLIAGHLLPFHIFKETPLNYLNIFEKADDKFINVYNENEKIVLCGDFNFGDAKKLFPKMMEKCKETIEEPTKNNKQSDHLIISNNLECSYSEVKDNIFDHKFIISETKK